MNSGIFKGFIKALAISGTILLVVAIIKFFVCQITIHGLATIETLLKEFL